MDKLYGICRKPLKGIRIPGFEADRTIEETLDLGWKLLRMLPRTELTRIREAEKYY